MTNPQTFAVFPTMTAVVTAPGASALASIEIHGPDTVDIARRLFHSAGVHPNFGRERGQYYGRFGREVVDDVVLAVLDPLASDPGDNAVFPTVQVHCHGGSAMTRSLMNEIQSLGAKVVDWRELMAARGVHWTRIEAAEALGQCKAWRAAAVLLDQWNGSLERAFHAPLPLSTSDATVRNVGNTQRELAESVLQWWEFGRRLVEGWRIMLLGRPNVGKSMLLNALLGYERVIVHDLPGTTRDVIEVEAALDGWPVRLCDAAGLRDSTDPIEQAGVEKAREWAQSADLRILVYDVSEEFDERDPMRSQVHPHIVLGNKTDLAIRWNKQQLRELDLLVSAETSAGLDRLLEAMVTRIVPNAPALGQPIPFTSRQVEWLKTFLNADGQPLSQK